MNERIFSESNACSDLKKSVYLGNDVKMQRLKRGDGVKAHTNGGWARK